jgi:hypothetical protein
MTKTIIPAQLIAAIYQYLLARPMGEVREMVLGLEAIINAEAEAQKGNGQPQDAIVTEEVTADG